MDQHDKTFLCGIFIFGLLFTVIISFYENYFRSECTSYKDYCYIQHSGLFPKQEYIDCDNELIPEVYKHRKHICINYD